MCDEAALREAARGMGFLRFYASYSTCFRSREEARRFWRRARSGSGGGGGHRGGRGAGGVRFYVTPAMAAFFYSLDLGARVDFDSLPPEFFAPISDDNVDRIVGLARGLGLCPGIASYLCVPSASLSKLGSERCRRWCENA